MKLCDIKLFWLIIVISIFLLSIFYIFNVRIEGMKVRYDCPNLLEEKNDGIFELSYQNNIKHPNYYYNLEEYVKLVNWQKENNITCPILSVNPSKTELSPASLTPVEDEKITQLIDASRDSEIYNVNSYPGFDPDNQYIGIKTPLDVLHNFEEKKDISGNAMDINWGGQKYTSKLVKDGYYKDNSR
tara:strand:- start:14 stop:571 length:558 start_codon:yes stop_codon:yes gene_type:complete